MLDRKPGSRWAALILAVAVLAAVGFIAFRSPPAGRPVAVDGVLDLTGWDFAKDGPVDLDGDWELYWNRLLSPEDLAAGEGGRAGIRTGFVPVPSDWVGSFGGTKTTPMGSATYRLRVLLPAAETRLSLRTYSIRLSNRIFVDGVDVGSSGNPALASQGGYVPNNTPYVADLQPLRGAIEIVVQVSDYDFIAGGIIKSLTLGRQQDVQGLAYGGAFLSALFAVCFFVTGIYFLFLFLGRRKDLSLLYYGLANVLSAFFEMFFDQKLILQILPVLETHFRLLTRVSTIFGNLIILFMCLFFQKLAERIIPRTMAILAVVLLGGLSLVYVVVPMSILSAIQPGGMLLGFIFNIVIAGAITTAYVRKRNGGIGRRSLGLIALAYACNIFYGVDAALFYMNLKSDILVGNVAMLVSIVVIFLGMSENFNASVKTVEEMNRKLLEVDRIKDEFLINTSHELRTPLNGMINLTQSVLDQTTGETLGPERREDLQIAIAAGRRLGNLVDDILDLASLKQGETHLALGPVDIRAIASGVLYVMSHLRRDRSIELIDAIPEDLPPAEADEHRVWQIYYNLVGNALKFTNSGRITIGGRRQGSMLELWVEDTGRGISSEHLEDIFAPFYQENPGVEGKTAGTGLGLSITRRLIDLHGGRISAESDFGAGSRFVFMLPVHEGETTPQLENPPMKPERYLEELLTHSPVPKLSGARRKQPGRYSVLVAEDDPTSRRALAGILKVLECDVTTAADGLEVLEAIARGPGYDLLVLDLMMPKVNGFEVLQTVRGRFSAVELPVLLLTARTRPEDIKAGFSAGANDYIAKPFEAEELKARVMTLLSMKASVDSLVASELSFLQAQIKPHFLYNALSVIGSLSIREPARSKKLLLDLSDYLRGSFQFENHDGLTPLASEIKTTEAYLAIEKARFKDRLNVRIEVDEHLDVSVPVLSIQPLVENALRHGILGKLEGGVLTLRVTRIPGGVKVEIEDDGVGMEQAHVDRLLDARGKQGIGLANIHKRLLSLYGEGLSIDSEPGRGTRVSFTVPAQAGQE